MFSLSSNPIPFDLRTLCSAFFAQPFLVCSKPEDVCFNVTVGSGIAVPVLIVNR